MSFMNERDAISGKHASATIIIDGKREELFFAKSLEATIEKNKADVPVLGKTGIGKKATGWSGSGTLTVYYMTSLFRELTRKYIAEGVDFYFELMVTNDDPSSSIGKQVVSLKNCNLDSVTAAAFDASSEDMMEEELAFTFEDYDITDQFSVFK